MDCIQNTDVETFDDLKSEFVNWKLFNRDVISRFQTINDRNLERLNLCDKIGCNSDHRPQIDNAYRVIVSALKRRDCSLYLSSKKEIYPCTGLESIHSADSYIVGLEQPSLRGLRLVRLGLERYLLFEEMKAT